MLQYQDHLVEGIPGHRAYSADGRGLLSSQGRSEDPPPSTESHQVHSVNAL